MYKAIGVGLLLLIAGCASTPSNHKCLTKEQVRAEVIAGINGYHKDLERYGRLMYGKPRYKKTLRGKELRDPKTFKLVPLPKPKPPSPSELDKAINQMFKDAKGKEIHVYPV
jgi:hypothetical protein